MVIRIIGAILASIILTAIVSISVADLSPVKVSAAPLPTKVSAGHAVRQQALEEISDVNRSSTPVLPSAVVESPSPAPTPPPAEIPSHTPVSAPKTSPVTQVPVVHTYAPAPQPSVPVSRSSGVDWYKLAQCESSGNWSIDTGNGFYGGLQFSESTWLAYGGGSYALYANTASPAQQIAVAERVLAAQGPGAWPASSARGASCGF